jgi:hypothetical protein
MHFLRFSKKNLSFELNRSPEKDGPAAGFCPALTKMFFLKKDPLMHLMI